MAKLGSPKSNSKSKSGSPNEDSSAAAETQAESVHSSNVEPVADLAKSASPESIEEMNVEDLSDLNVVPLGNGNKIGTPVLSSILIESLLKGVCSLYETDQARLETLYRMTCERLYEMKIIDESYRMTELESVRAKFQKILHKILTDISTAVTTGTDDKSAVALRRPLAGGGGGWWPFNENYNSRYFQEFEEMEYIAGGGFGKVFRARHILDGNEYAVKKIPIREEGITAVCKYLSEVKTFSSLNHPNIVQYKNAWLELGAPSSPAIAQNSESTDGETEAYADSTALGEDSRKPHRLDQECTPYDIHRSTLEHSFSDKDRNRHLDSHNDSSSSDFEIKFEHSVHSMTTENETDPEMKKEKRQKRTSISEGGTAVCKLDMQEIARLKVQQRARTKWATLHIQMELCQATLKQWLEIRNQAEASKRNANNLIVPVKNYAQNEKIYDVLRQILKGLDYIHCKGMVHHDIKPSNIFIQFDNGKILVQLGDFGLACPLQSVRHALGIGTKTYAAPEQLAGLCNPKSDMYSVGIVLLELAESFGTDMERIRCIEEARKGNLPARLQLQNPQMVKIIRQLLQKDPKQRPEASDLLQSITDKSDAYIHHLEGKLMEKDEEITRLKEMLRSAGLESPQ